MNMDSSIAGLLCPIDQKNP